MKNMEETTQKRIGEIMDKITDLCNEKPDWGYSVAYLALLKVLTGDGFSLQMYLKANEKTLWSEA